eukprot:symbB.v1.2.031286.t1/scaffold3616.1/size53225/6
MIIKSLATWWAVIVPVSAMRLIPKPHGTAFPVLVHRKHSNRSNLELQISSEDRHGTPTLDNVCLWRDW